MANRITRVTTRTGDTGTSGTATGIRLPKTDALFAAMGDVDELNSHIGLIRAAVERFPDFADAVQQSLFDLGACLATAGATPPPDALPLEGATQTLNDGLPPLREFVLPGGSEAAARCHVARAVCRRAERSVWALVEQSAERDPAGESLTACAVYLNRLSDLLFVWARTLARQTGEELVWRGTGRR